MAWKCHEMRWGIWCMGYSISSYGHSIVDYIDFRSMDLNLNALLLGAPAQAVNAISILLRLSSSWSGVCCHHLKHHLTTKANFLRKHIHSPQESPFTFAFYVQKLGRKGGWMYFPYTFAMIPFLNCEHHFNDLTVAKSKNEVNLWNGGLMTPMGQYLEGNQIK